MPSSRRAAAIALGTLLAIVGQAPVARAQRQVQGFAVERFYGSAPGAGWFVMDDLALHGRLGGALSLTLGYARNPWRVTDGIDRLAPVSDQAFADIAAAITYDRWRFHVGFAAPLAVRGESGVIAGEAFTAPTVDLASHPDLLSDLRIGTEVRIFGRPDGHFRLGAGGELWVPFGGRDEYDSDGSFRGMLRLLAAGDAPYFAYAAQLGAHVRPLDTSPAPGPRGSELLFGIAAGAKLPLGAARSWLIVVGPEVYGAAAFRSFSSNGSAVEGLLGARVERTRTDRVQLRIKLGAGAGLNAHLGAAQWRLVLGIEVFARAGGKRPDTGRDPPPDAR